ncbi:Uncharacterized protein HZ326_22345 [Fusarium oxysporum f. sp. albedinis]|nr:Uncharacterized protein HZ326_22345 [Fusarium oxysporum f. sp. albedinis]
MLAREERLGHFETRRQLPMLERLPRPEAANRPFHFVPRMRTIWKVAGIVSGTVCSKVATYGNRDFRFNAGECG